MSAQDTPYVLRVGAGPQAPQAEHALLGYRIPFLPEGPSRPELAALGEQDQVRDALAAQARAIAALAPYKQGAASLRYFVDPARKAIDVVLLVRATGAAGQAQPMAASLAQTLVAQLAQMRIPADPIMAEAELRGVLAPPAPAAIVEIRQHEEMVSLKLGAGYAVSPWRATASTWISALGTFLGQVAPFVVSVHLEPTQLYPTEQTALMQAASVARQAADLEYEGTRRDYHIVDSQAGVVAALYADYLQRLRDPFLVAVQVASPNAMTAQAAAAALAAEISTQLPMRSGNAAGALPSGYDIVAAQSAPEVGAAMHTLSMLQLAIWGPTHATPEQQRLRFLVDATTASAAFRFPLALRGGLPGIRTSRPAGADVRGVGQIDRNVGGVS